MRPRVLVADDQRDFVELIAFNLSRIGCDVYAAGNGLEALDRAREFLPDVIVLDVTMPGLDGFTVFEILRSQPSTNSIPVALYAGRMEDTHHLMRYDLETDRLLIKPFRIQKLVLRVRELLRLQGTRNGDAHHDLGEGDR